MEWGEPTVLVLLDLSPVFDTIDNHTLLGYLKFWFCLNLMIYLGFYTTFNTTQVTSQRVIFGAEETSTYSWSMFCTVNC